MSLCGYVHANEGIPWSPEALELPGARVTYTYFWTAGCRLWDLNSAPLKSCVTGLSSPMGAVCLFVVFKSSDKKTSQI